MDMRAIRANLRGSVEAVDGGHVHIPQALVELYATHSRALRHPLIGLQRSLQVLPPGVQQSLFDDSEPHGEARNRDGTCIKAIFE